MALEPGSKLGAYEIVAALDTGSGGEIYKAADAQSNREVAIRVCAGPLSERSEQEALAIAALHHPNICALHDIGHEDGTNFLVMEYLEGQTLAARLEKGGALDLDKAVKAAIEIADALDQAHLAGVIHRGLQPSKIFLTLAGAKLLDFGMSEVRAPEPPPAAATSPKGLAKAGAQESIDGSLAYTAPECLEGKMPDERSDIFAFGTIVYEMVTGKKAFEGKSRAVMIAMIATTDPDPLAKSQPAAPALLQHIVQRCLDKDPEERWQTMHDLLVQLRWMTEGGELASAAYAPRLGKITRILLASAAVLILAMAVPGARYLRGPANAEIFQFRIPVRGLNTSDIALSPDGKMIAMVAKPTTGLAASLYVRRTGAVSFQRLGGTDDAAQPFWSPDSRYIAFLAAGRLKQVNAAGGAPKDIADAPGFMGGAWNREGTIVFGSAKGLFRVSAEGGKPAAITTMDSQETGHYWPSFLPDGQHFLYLSWASQAGSRSVYLGKLGAKDKIKLMAAESNAQYAAPGYILFHREASLFAQAFDPVKLALRGEPVHVADDVASSAGNGRGNFDVSQDGSLVYFQGAGAPSGRGQILFSNVQWGFADRTGRPTPTAAYAGEPGPYGDFDLSPDGKLIAVTKQESGPGADIWVIDWQRAGVTNRVTMDPADDIGPVWSPDGKRIAFTTYRKGNADIYVVEPGSGVGKDTPLLETPADEVVKDWSKDGKYIAYLHGQGDTYDIYALPLVDGKPSPDQKPFPVVQGHFQKSEPQFSYDGKWLAYTSDRTLPGTFQVYIRSFPAGDQEIAVSTAGGGQPRWRKDGKELYYRAPDDMIMVVDIKPGPNLEAGSPRPLFIAPLRNAVTRDPVRHLLAVSPDGERFLLRVPPGGGGRGGTGGALGNMGVAEVPILASTTTPVGGRGAVVTASTPYSGLTVIQHWPSALGKAEK
jgi:Tol biopolymer transport system component